MKSFFNDYSGGKNKIEDEGLEKFFADIGLDLEDLTVIYVGMIMETERADQITYDQFKKGCEALNADSLQKWKAAVASAKGTWKSNQTTYKAVYMHSFVVNRETGMNNLDTETAIALWGMFCS